jgi:hypothetical protein
MENMPDDEFRYELDNGVLVVSPAPSYLHPQDGEYAESGLAGLEDAHRPGGPKTVLTDEAVCEILAATVTPPPESLQAQGVTHWSSRRLAVLRLHREPAAWIAHRRDHPRPACAGGADPRLLSS